MKPHTVRRFDEQLEDIKNSVMSMGGFAEQQLANALHALKTGDTALAETVIRNDKRLNRVEQDIDNACILLLAQRTPVASDLRLVMSMIKVINDLERIGDEAKEVARTVNGFVQVNAQNLDFAASLQEMGEEVKKMLRKSLDALARSDVYSAAELHKDDRRINDYYYTILHGVLTFVRENACDIAYISDICTATRALERIGDRCRNIGEYVIYLVRGQDVRHADFAREGFTTD